MKNDSTVSHMHISDYYKELLKNKDLKVPNLKGWHLIQQNNVGFRRNNVALSENDKTITFDEMFDVWDQYAKAFTSVGITRDNKARVLVITPNVAKACNIDYALDMTGAVCDFIDPTTNSDKIEKYIESEKITDIVVLDLLYEQNLRKNISRIKEKYGINNVIVFKDSFMNTFMPKSIGIYSDIKNVINKFSSNIIRFDDILRNSKYTQIAYDNSDSKELSLITHTSGTTTGMGKPIPISDYNRNALVLQHDLAELDFVPGMKMLHFIPYFAAYGSVNTAHLGLAKGMELQQVPLFKPSDFGMLLLKHKPNIVLSIMTAWMSLLDDPLMKNADLSFLKCVVSGGSPARLDDLTRLNEFLKEHGCSVLPTTGYGLSELCGCGTYSIDNYNNLGGIGVPLPLTDIKIRDTKTGEIIINKGSPIQGELLIHSPSMTSGVLDNKVVVDTIDIDGKSYLPTKDIVIENNDGSLEYVERKDRMFQRYDAYNFYPLSIENLLKEHTKIDGCVIVPYFDESKNGNVPRVYIKTGCEIENKEEYIYNIINNLFLYNDNLEGYKANFRDIPHSWVFVSEIPRNTMGKEDYYLIKNGGLEGIEYYADIEENNISVSHIKINKVKDSKVIIKK